MIQVRTLTLTTVTSVLRTTFHTSTVGHSISFLKWKLNPLPVIIGPQSVLAHVRLPDHTVCFYPIRGETWEGGGGGGAPPPQSMNHPDWQGNQNAKNSNKIK
jgi:hypothetical protein